MRAMMHCLLFVVLCGCQQKAGPLSPSGGEGSRESKIAKESPSPDVPEDVQALVPMFMRWALLPEPLPGQPDAHYGDTKYLRSLLEHASAKVIYIGWNAPGDGGAERFGWKYEIDSGIVTRLSAKDRAVLEARWNSGLLMRGEESYFTVSSTAEGKTKVAFSVGMIHAEFLLRREGKAFVVEKTLGMLVQ